MADVSKIKVPNGTVYDLKDETARAGLAGKANASHTHSEYASKSKYGDTTINVGRKADTLVGLYSTAEGYDTLALGNYSHAEGCNTTASGISSHAEGGNIEPSGKFNNQSWSFTTENGITYEILSTTADSICAHAEGGATFAHGTYSHSEGYHSMAFSNCAHAEGDGTHALGNGSHAEGYHTTASVGHTHAEGTYTTASGGGSHAEGSSTTASGDYSHAEGSSTTASGDYSHAEGSSTTANGNNSHAEGYNTTASGHNSHAEGLGTIASKNAESASGKYNLSNSDTLFSIGDGTADDARHNAFEITTTGGKLHDKDIATTDLIPTELPANGGNADTVGLRYSNDFLGKDYVYPTFVNYGFGADLNNYVTEYHGFIYNCENSPIAHDFGFLDVSFFDGTGFAPSPPDKGGVVLQRFTRVDNCAFTRMRYANVWSGWKEISTTPIKKMTFPSVAINSGGGGVLFLTDFGTPITIACTSRRDTQCTPFFVDNQWLVLAKDCATLDPIPAGTYSFDVWYI